MNIEEKNYLRALYSIIFLSIGLHVLFAIRQSDFVISEELEQQVVQKIKKELPGLIAEMINNQIHELAMDKIKLEGITSFNAAQVQAMRNELQYVIKVGQQILNKEEFTSRLNTFAARDEFANQPHEDVKQKLVEELKKHYAIIQDSLDQKFDQEADFLQQIDELERKIFLAELLQKNIIPINENEILEYYQKNLQLYEHSRHFSYKMIESADQDSLLPISSVELFLNSGLPIVEKTKEHETQIPIFFVRALNETETNSLTEIIRSQNKFYLLLKTAPSGKIYIPIEQVSQFISEHLSFERIQEAIRKIANPLRFEYAAELKSDVAYIGGNPVSNSVLEISASVLPPRFIETNAKNNTDREMLKLNLALIFQKYQQNTQYFSADIISTTAARLKAYRENLLIQTWQNKIQNSVVVKEHELKDFYESRKDQFVKTLGRQARHIFVNDQSQALSVLNMALMDPNSFAVLAKTHSKEERTAPHGGDMRYLSPADITAEMNEIVRQLRPGEVYRSLIAGVSGGFHIIRFEQELPAEIARFEQVKAQIQEILTRDRSNRAMSKAISEALQKYPSFIDEALLSSL